LSAKHLQQTGTPVVDVWWAVAGTAGGRGGLMPLSGEHCIEPGIYISQCGAEWTVHLLKPGDEFPPCPHCHRNVHYTLLDR
jgi:hypothetical protein